MELHLFLLAGQFPGVSHHATLAAAARYAQAAETHGFAGVWIAEHHFISYGVCPSAITFAAHLLGRTERITVGTAACVLSNRHPVALGEEAVLLDELSGGRLALGVGRGGPWIDLDVFGAGLDRYAHGFTESLDLLLAWLSGAPQVGGDGARFRFPPVTVVPRPRRSPPVWVAATSTATAELAARRGLPLLLGMHATDEERAAMIARHSEVSREHGHDPQLFEHAAALLAQVGADDESARRLVRRSLPALLAGTRDYVRIDGSPSRHRDLDAYTEQLIEIGAVGSLATCRRRLADSVAATGVRHLLLMVEAAGEPAAVLANIEQLAACLPGAPDGGGTLPAAARDGQLAVQLTTETAPVPFAT